jgi:fucose permease
LELSSNLADTDSIATATTPTRTRGPLYIVLTNRLCWLLALYLVLYLGLEISTGGWLVEFMIQVPSHLCF